MGQEVILVKNIQVGLKRVFFLWGYVYGQFDSTWRSDKLAGVFEAKLIRIIVAMSCTQFLEAFQSGWMGAKTITDCAQW